VSSIRPLTKDNEYELAFLMLAFGKSLAIPVIEKLIKWPIFYTVEFDKIHKPVNAL